MNRQQVLEICSGSRWTQHPPNLGAAARSHQLPHQPEAMPLVEGYIPFINLSSGEEGKFMDCARVRPCRTSSEPHRGPPGAGDAPQGRASTNVSWTLNSNEVPGSTSTAKSPATSLSGPNLNGAKQGHRSQRALHSPGGQPNRNRFSLSDNFFDDSATEGASQFDTGP